MLGERGSQAGERGRYVMESLVARWVLCGRQLQIMEQNKQKARMCLVW